MKRMGYVKRKGSNADKVEVSKLKELRDVYIADIVAEVIMNDIHPDMIFNWDQTAIQFVPTGQWTMNRAKEKVIPIAHSDDKRQITAVLAATVSGKYLPVQLIYKGTTQRCHPKVAVPDSWDVWHSANHWSTEETMKRYIEKIVVPFLEKTRKTLKLASNSPALAIFDGFKGQTTPEFLALLEKHNIIPLLIPANCTDKLQPMDISINKPIKDRVKESFQLWYAAEVQSQLKAVPINQVKVELKTAVLKAKTVTWLASAWHSMTPAMAINGFKKAGILDVLTEALKD